MRPVEVADTEVERPWRGSGVLRRILQEEQPDLVHVMHPMRFPHVFIEAGAAAIPAVAHVPDFFYACARITMVRADGSLCDSPEDGERCVATCGIASGRERLAWGRLALAEARAVICPCRATIERHRRIGFDVGRWHHIPWGVDYALYPERLGPPPPGPLRVGFLGTLLEHKGARVVVDAVRARPGLEVELRLYGESFHERDYERALRQATGGDPRIVFAGTYGHADLRAILAGLDAVVVPSLWHENVPTTALNAVAAGVPLLVSDVEGLVELIDDYRCGLVFRRGDPEDLAALLERLRRDPMILREIRSGALSPPGVDEEARRLEALYEDIRPK